MDHGVYMGGLINIYASHRAHLVYILCSGYYTNIDLYIYWFTSICLMQIQTIKGKIHYFVDHYYAWRMPKQLMPMFNS